MNHFAKRSCFLLLLHLLVLSTTARADTIWFSGYNWDVRNGSGGPGPNHWDPQNVFVDTNGNLHLLVTQQQGQWTTAEVTLTQSLGFGEYQFQLIGRPDQFDPNIVFGMFNYNGVDGTNEISIEHGQFGNSQADQGHNTVYPAQPVQNFDHATFSYPISLNGTFLTERFFWTSNQITFQSLHGHYDDNTNLFSSWTYHPQDPGTFIPQLPAPVHLNMWLAAGQAPTNGQPVEIIVSSFKFTPVGEPSSVFILSTGFLALASLKPRRAPRNHT